MLATSLMFMALLLLSIPAQAFTIVTAEPGDTKHIPNVSELATGLDMAGMKVTATGLNQNGDPFTSPVTVWAAPIKVGSPPSPPVYGGAFPNGLAYAFYLFHGGDTFSNSWWLWVPFYNFTLHSLTIEALPGKVVFDRTIDGMEKTSGSGLGKDFATNIPNAFPTFSYPHRAIYRDQVAVGGKDPQGDLYATLEIIFSYGEKLDGTPDIKGQFFIGSDNNFFELFTADTDRITTVPLPGSVLLLSGGLLRLYATWRRRRI